MNRNPSFLVLILIVSKILLSSSSILCQPTVDLWHGDRNSQYATDSSIVVNASFSEKITGLEIGDFVVENGLISSLGSPIEYFPSKSTYHEFPYAFEIKAKETGDVYYLIANDKIIVERVGGEVDEISLPWNILSGMDIDSEGNIYVSLLREARIDVYTNNGNLIRSFGEGGTGEGQFNGNNIIAIGPNDTLYVIDKNNARVQAFKTNGEYLFSIERSFLDLDVDKNGNLYGMYRNGIVKYSFEGDSLNHIDAPNSRIFKSFSVVNGFVHAIISDEPIDGNDSMVLLDQSGDILREVKPDKNGFGGGFSVIESSSFSKKSLVVPSRGSKIVFDLDYTVQLNIDPSTEGSMSVFLPEGAVSNSVGEYNLESDTLNIIFDWTRPTVNLSLEQGSLGKAYVMTAEMSESILGNSFRYEALGEGAISGSFNSYFRAQIRANIDSGVVKIVVPDDAFFDLAGNGNIESDTLTVYYNINPLKPRISSIGSQYSSTKKLKMNIKFNKPVEDFTSKDLMVVNADIISFNGGNSEYMVELIGEEESIVGIEVREGCIHDEWGQANQKANFSFLVDISNPNFTINSAITDSKENPLISIEIVFDDPIFDYLIDPIYCTAFPSYCFHGDDVMVEGGQVTSFRSEGFGVYKLEVIPQKSSVVVTIPDSVAYNFTDLPNIESGTYQIDFEGTLVLSLEDDQANVNWTMGNQFLNVDINDTGFNDGKLALIDLNGRMILSQDIYQTNSQIDISMINPGVYILVTQWKDKLFKTKISID